MRSNSSKTYTKTLLASSAMAATIVLGLTTASAQSRPEGGTTQLTPEQRSAIRAVIREKLADDMRERIADRLADDAAGAKVGHARMPGGRGSRDRGRSLLRSHTRDVLSQMGRDAACLTAIKISIADGFMFSAGETDHQ